MAFMPSHFYIFKIEEKNYCSVILFCCFFTIIILIRKKRRWQFHYLNLICHSFLYLAFSLSMTTTSNLPSYPASCLNLQEFHFSRHCCMHKAVHFHVEITQHLGKESRKARMVDDMKRRKSLIVYPDHSGMIYRGPTVSSTTK